MATENSDKDIDEMVQLFNNNPKYRILTKEEHDNLLANQNISSTPNVKPSTKFSFTAPGVSPIPRLQMIPKMTKQIPEVQNTILNNTSFSGQHNLPKIPHFSGSEEPQKGEVTYEVWRFEIKCLQNSGYLPEHLLLQAIRNSLKGNARSILISLGEDAVADGVLNQLDDYYGNVSTAETLLQSFYNDFQKESESIVAYGSRLEIILSRAIRSGHIELSAKDAMLRSKFWTGLKNPELRNASRHLFDSTKNFHGLLREIRKVEQEDSAAPRPTAKPKVVHQHSEKASVESDDSTNKQILQQIREMMKRMKILEEKVDSNTYVPSEVETNQTFDSNYNANFKRNQGRGRGFRNGNRGGRFQRGTYGRGAGAGGWSNDMHFQQSNG